MNVTYFVEGGNKDTFPLKCVLIIIKVIDHPFHHWGTGGRKHVVPPVAAATAETWSQTVRPQ